MLSRKTVSVFFPLNVERIGRRIGQSSVPRLEAAHNKRLIEPQ